MRAGMTTTTIALSVRQPWAGWIASGQKPVENRSWPCPAKYVGKSILIHSTADHDRRFRPVPGGWAQRSARSGSILLGNMAAPWHMGGIIGSVVIVDCVRDYVSPWAESGKWHWVLACARILPFVPCPGRLGFWRVPEGVAKAMAERLAA